MTDSMLDRFLDIGMLPGTDDESLKKLEVAAGNLAMVLKDDLSKLRLYACAMLDSDLADTDSTLDEVESAVQAEWRSLRNAFPTRPVILLRAVMADAIARTVAQDDWRPSAIVWLTGASLLPLATLGKERSLIDGIYRNCGTKAEQHAVSMWQSPPTTSIVGINLPKKPEFSLEKPTINEANLTGHLRAAAGPNNSQGQPSGVNPNPHWPQNNPQAWVSSFGSRAATGIKQVVDASLSILEDSVEKAFVELHTYTISLSKSVATYAKENNEAIKRETGGSRAYLTN